MQHIFKRVGTPDPESSLKKYEDRDMTFWESTERQKELSKKTLGELTENEWKESQRLTREHIEKIKNGLMEEWNLTEEDWQTLMSETEEE